MSVSPIAASLVQRPDSTAQPPAASPKDRVADDVKLKFEQMLWAEMLSQAGLEKSLTLGGGEAASAFSRYVVESIAADIAAKHPLGLTANVDLNPLAASTEQSQESQIG